MLKAEVTVSVVEQMGKIKSKTEKTMQPSVELKMVWMEAELRNVVAEMQVR